jgi:hypothetical protein
MHAPPGVIWLKLGLHVHAPLPLIPWSHRPPMPHAHGWQDGPKKPAAHWLQTLFTETKPAGHAPPHVSVRVLRTWPGGHDVQVVAVPTQAAHRVVLHAAQADPTVKYVPAGHVATQLVPLSRGVADPGVQSVQSVLLVHAPQVDSHGTHATPFE